MEFGITKPAPVAMATPVASDLSPDTPSIKVSSVPDGTSSDELHQAMITAGCRGGITDVYIPKGNRGFGFVRFTSMREAEMASQLNVRVNGSPVQLEIAVSERKPGKGKGAMCGLDAGKGCGYGPAAGCGGYGPAKGLFGPSFGKTGPFGGKAIGRESARKIDGQHSSLLSFLAVLMS